MLCQSIKQSTKKSINQIINRHQKVYVMFNTFDPAEDLDIPVPTAPAAACCCKRFFSFDLDFLSPLAEVVELTGFLFLGSGLNGFFVGISIESELCRLGSSPSTAGRDFMHPILGV